MPSAAAPAGASVAAFLRAARRRALLRDLLAAALVSAAADVVLRLGVIALGRQLSRELPAFFEGIYLFLVLAVLAWRRQTPERVAGRVDDRLKLKDRLTSFLAFGRDGGAVPEFVRAQAVEAAATLAAIAPRRAVPVPRLLWLGPLAFFWMLYVSYFAFFRPEDLPTLTQVARRVPAPAGTPGAAKGPAADRSPAPGAEKPAAGAGESDRPRAGAPDRPGTGEKRAALPWEQPHGESGGSANPAPAGPTPGGTVEKPFTPAGDPTKLFSNPVGEGLTPVAPDAASPAARPRPADAAPALRGRVAFSLVPAGGGDLRRGGSGARPGGGRAEGLEITVDFDAVPPELRAYVGRYFEALARRGKGGDDGGS